MKIPSILQPYSSEKPDPNFWDQSLAIPVISYFSGYDVTCSDSFGRDTIIYNHLLDMTSIGLDEMTTRIVSLAIKILIIYPVLVVCSVLDLLIWTVKIIPAIYKCEIKQHFEILISIIALPILGLVVSITGKAVPFLFRISQIDKHIQELEMEGSYCTEDLNRLFSLMLTKQSLGAKESSTVNRMSFIFHLLNLIRQSQNNVVAADFLKRCYNPFLPGMRDKTVLFQTLRLGDLELLKVVLNSGVDVNEAVDKYGLPILIRLAIGTNDSSQEPRWLKQRKYQKVLNHLLKHCKHHGKINIENENFATPLVTAAVRGNTHMVKLLLRYEAEFYIEDFEHARDFGEEILRVPKWRKEVGDLLGEQRREYEKVLIENQVRPDPVLEDQLCSQRKEIEKVENALYALSKLPNLESVDYLVDNVYLRENKLRLTIPPFAKETAILIFLERVANIPQVKLLHNEWIAKRNSIIVMFIDVTDIKWSGPMSIILGYLPN